MVDNSAAGPEVAGHVAETAGDDAAGRVVGGARPQPGQGRGRLRLSAARVLTSGGWRDAATVVVEDGRIIEVGPCRGPVPDRLLVPGFVDLQCNGIEDVDVARADGAAWERLDARLTAQGVTTWCPTLVSAPLDRYGAALGRIGRAAARPAGPRPDIAGVHLEGPFLGGRPGAHHPAWVVPLDLDWLAALPPLVRIVTLGPEQREAVPAIAQLTARGVLAALGHTDAGPAAVAAASAAGARLITHLFNAMRPFHHREPGPVAAALLDDRLSCAVVADGHHVHAQALALTWRLKGEHRMVLVTDAVAWAAGGLGDGGLELRDGVPQRPDGTLAGSALTMDAAIRYVVREAGVPLEAAVRAAATNPARLLGLSDRGCIAAGQRADLVALSHDLEVEVTWVGGRRT